MACKIVVSPGAVFAVWGKPSRAELDFVHEEMMSSAEQAGKKIVYVSRVPTDAPAPDQDVRKYMAEVLPRSTLLPN